MGDRSNVNVVVSNNESGDSLGVNIYSHWGGLFALKGALNGADLERINDSGYFIASVIRGMGGNVSGVEPRFDVYPEDWSYADDNPILTFNLPLGQICIRDTQSGNFVYFDLTHEGIAEALALFAIEGPTGYINLPTVVDKEETDGV